MAQRDDLASNPLLRVLEPDEEVHLRTVAREAAIAVTDRRVAVVVSDRIVLDVPIVGIRRIQFDIERRRPATLVIVPDAHEHDAQVLTIPPEQYPDVSRLLELLGSRFADDEPSAQEA